MPLTFSKNAAIVDSDVAYMKHFQLPYSTLPFSDRLTITIYKITHYLYMAN